MISPRTFGVTVCESNHVRAWSDVPPLRDAEGLHHLPCHNHSHSSFPWAPELELVSALRRNPARCERISVMKEGCLIVDHWSWVNQYGLIITINVCVLFV